MKKLNKKGFTLAELLIVVAIIAVLVAVAIPVFTSQLNKAKAATDAANIRAGYAEVAVKVLDTPNVDATYFLKADGTVTTTETDLYACKGSASDLDAGTNVGGTAASTIAWTAGKNIKYTYTASTGVITPATK